MNVNTNLRDIFHWARNPKGEFGIEIEVEGGPFPEGSPTNWQRVEDHSLRNGGVEYVIRNPLREDNVRGALETLRDFLGDTPLSFTYRTSVHVHVNVQDLTIKQWVNFLVAFTILEEALVDVVGPKRAGNKFCLRAVDADETLRQVRDNLRSGNITAGLGGDLKYASMNIVATLTHGTLEFRAMEGNLDVDRITQWVNVLSRIKDYARQADDPTAIVGEMSRWGPAMWAARVLPDNDLTRQLFARQDINDVLYDGVRVAQDLAFGTDWTNDAPPAEAPRPVRDRMDVDMDALRDLIRNPVPHAGWGEVRAAPAPAPRMQVPFRVRDPFDPFD